MWHRPSIAYKRKPILLTIELEREKPVRANLSALRPTHNHANNSSTPYSPIPLFPYSPIPLFPFFHIHLFSFFPISLFPFFPFSITHSQWLLLLNPSPSATLLNPPLLSKSRIRRAAIIPSMNSTNRPARGIRLPRFPLRIRSRPPRTAICCI